jgi:hypothetical protein
MADELTVSVSLLFNKSGKRVQFPRGGGQQHDVSGSDFVWKTQLVGASEEALVMGEVTTPGWIIVSNLDSTAYLSIRNATGTGNCVEVKASETQAFRLARTATAPFVISSSGTIEIEYCLIED